MQSPDEHDQDVAPATGLHPRAAAGDHEQVDVQAPPTPITPLTPAVQSVEHGYDESKEDVPETPDKPASSDENKVPAQDPVLALRVSRTGHMFATITKTSITIWQTKVCPLRSVTLCV